MNVNRAQYIYLIGIGGVGMSALARYFNAKGINVCGYDKVRSDLCMELEYEGVKIHHVDEVLSIPDSIRNSSYTDILVIYTCNLARLFNLE